MHGPQKNMYNVHYHLIAALSQFLNIEQLRSRCLAVCQFRANTLLRKANGRVQI